LEITWYGHACFRLRERNAIVITDPYDDSIGYTLPRMRADIVTISHDVPDHNHAQSVRGNPKVLKGPGEYEIKGVFITGIPTLYGRKRGTPKERNVVFLFEFEGLTVCHLGDLAHVPTQSQIEALSDIDVLLIPVGGGEILDASLAAEVISLLEPRLVIPMSYRTKGTTLKLASVNTFLRAMGRSRPPVQDVLKVTRNKLPEETQLVLLECKQG